MSISDEIKNAEKAIDEEFHKKLPQDLEYAQAIWTLLSVVEDQHLMVYYIHRLPDEQIPFFIDQLMNALSYPIRSIYKKQNGISKKLSKEFIDDHYSWAVNWIEDAKMYNDFCSIFPLWHRKIIDLKINDNFLEISNWKNLKPEYEAYNRIYKKKGNPKIPILDLNNLVSKVMENVNNDKTKFEFKLNPKIAKLLIDDYSSHVNGRYNLPDEWETSEFKFGEFKKVFTAIQALLYGRFIARTVLAKEGMEGLGYDSVIWVLTFDELLARLERYVSISSKTIKCILNVLTFGNEDIREPDIAIQPLVDLKNGFIALSPFVWMNSDAERNLCVLLNRIPREQKIYSILTNKKEKILFEEIKKYVIDLGYDIAYGNLSIGDPDLDIAIIDRKSNACLCMELKWFIEPSEIREVSQKLEELKKGVLQATEILRLYKSNDNKLVKEILGINENFRFAVCVASYNWIGQGEKL